MFGSSSVDLQKSFANFVESICIKNIHISEVGLDNSLEAFRAGCLILLNKNPGLCSIGVGEELCQIARKELLYVPKKDVQDDAGAFQVCAGPDAQIEAAIHAMQISSN